MKTLVRFIVALLPLFALAASGASGVKPNFSRSHYPMLQGSTSDTVVHFNALVPRLKTFSFRARPVGSPANSPANSNVKPIEATVTPVLQQSTEAVLHDKVIKASFSGLSPNTEYELELVATSKYGEEVVDKRTFKTFDLSGQKPLKVVTASCFCDEMKFEDIRNKIWDRAVNENPDFFLLMGDQTYVDSFDYVERHQATPLDVWMRYYRSFSENPLFRSSQLIPVFSTWDDHDTGVDNGTKLTPTILEAKRAFEALYGSENIPGVIERGKDGVQKLVSLRGQNFALLDNRSFRGLTDSTDRYGHFGEEQEKWLIDAMRTKPGPFFVVSGDMWGSLPVLKPSKDGPPKSMTESVFGEHPAQYKAMMAAMNATGKPFVLLSGDIHFSQIIEHGPDWTGTSRENPFETVEITSSPGHSIIFQPKPGEEVMWPDGQRVVGIKDYNVVVVDSTIIPDGIDIQATSVGLSDQPYFSFGKRIRRNTPEPGSRRKLLNGKFDSGGKKVKVALFDADDTLRIAPSKSVSASSVDDVAILPGVANKIAELAEQGYFIAIVSNQGGVRSGKVSFEVADGALRRTIELIKAQNSKAQIHYYDLGERGPMDYYSKPNLGMSDQLIRILKREGLEVDWSNSFMVGDAGYNKNQTEPRTGTKGTDFSDSDRLFAQNIGIQYHHPRDFFGWTKEIELAIKNRDVPGFSGVSAECTTPFRAASAGNP